MFMNTAKEIIKKLIDDLPETKTGQAIDFLLYLKNKPEQDLTMSLKEEEEIRALIENDERISSDEVRKILGLE